MDTSTAIIGAVTIPIVIAFLDLIVKKILSDPKWHKFYPLLAILFAVSWNIVGTGLTTGWIAETLWLAATIGMTSGIAAGYGYDKVVKPFKATPDTNLGTDQPTN